MTSFSYAIRPFIDTYTNDINDKSKRCLPSDVYFHWFDYFFKLEDVILDKDDIINIVERGIKK